MFVHFDDAISFLNQLALDAWEIYCEEKNIFLFSNDPVNSFLQLQESVSGLAVRLWRSSQTGFAYTTAKSSKALQQCVQKAYDSLNNGNDNTTGYSLSDIHINDENRDFFDAHYSKDSVHIILEDESFWMNAPEDFIFCVSKTVKHEELQWLLVNSAGAKIQCRETIWQCSGQWRIGQSQKRIMFEDRVASHFFNNLKPAWYHTIRWIKNFLNPNDAKMKIPDIIHLFLCPSAAADWLGMIYANLFSGNYLTEYSDNKEFSENLNIGVLTDDRTLPAAPGSAAFDKAGFPTQKISYQYQIEKKTRTNASKSFKPRSGWTERDAEFFPYESPGNFFIEAGTETPENVLSKIEKVIWVYRLFLTDAIVNSGAVGFEGFYLYNGQSLGYCNGIAGPLFWREWIERLQIRCNDLIINRRIASPSLLFENIPVHLNH